MAVKALSEIKEESGRNLDALVDDNTLVAGERSSTFGVFKFFQGIKNFFKGISALGTLTSTSRIPVTDSNGNVSYTTLNEIKTALSLVTESDLNNYSSIDRRYINSGQTTEVNIVDSSIYLVSGSHSSGGNAIYLISKYANIQVTELSKSNYISYSIDASSSRVSFNFIYSGQFTILKIR